MDIPRHAARSTPHWAWISVALLLLFVFDPGIMTNDSVQTLRQARSFEFTDWHPPIMAILWSVLDRLIPGPAGMLLAQCMLYAYACARLCAQTLPTSKARTQPWLATLLFSLFPPAMGLVGMIWKDIWMSGFLLLATSHLFSLANGAQGARRVYSAGMVLACCLLATAFRHNAVAATAGLLAGAIFHLWTARRLLPRLLRACAGGVVLAFALALLVSLFNTLVARPMHITTTMLLHDVAGVIMHSGDPEKAAALALSTPTRLTTDETTFLHKIERMYTPAAAGRLIYTTRNRDTPFAAINVYREDHDAEGVRAVWKMMVRQYPLAYLEHRSKSFACLMQLCNRATWIDRSYFLNDRYRLPDTVEADTWQRTLRRVFLSPQLAQLYSPAFWLLVTLAGGIVGARRLGERQGVLFFLGLSSLGLCVSLFFTSPIESYRYVHWTVMLGWLMVLWLAMRVLDTALGRMRAKSNGAPRDVAG